MASICVIARRLRDGHVQYGWGGGAGYFDFAGRRLLQWYDTPDKYIQSVYTNSQT